MLIKPIFLIIDFYIIEFELIIY